MGLAACGADGARAGHPACCFPATVDAVLRLACVSGFRVPFGEQWRERAVSRFDLSDVAARALAIQMMLLQGKRGGQTA
jgi:hypothetical protein